MVGMSVRGGLLTAIALLCAGAGYSQGLFPGICINSPRPVNVYLSKSLVCEGSLNCAIVNLRGGSPYLIEVRDPLDDKARPLFSDYVRTPATGMQTIVVRVPDRVGAVLKPAENPIGGADFPVNRQPQTGDVPPTVSRLQPKGPNPTEIARSMKPLISEDTFEEFMAALESANGEQVKWMLDVKMSQHTFLVKHIKAIIEANVPGDSSRMALIKRMYGSISDRENAFQLVNLISASAQRNELSEFIAQYNAQNP